MGVVAQSDHEWQYTVAWQMAIVSERVIVDAEWPGMTPSTFGMKAWARPGYEISGNE